MPEPLVQKRVLMAEPDPVSPDFRLPVITGSRSPTRRCPHFSPAPHAQQSSSSQSHYRWYVFRASLRGFAHEIVGDGGGIRPSDQRTDG